jgi:FkbM family methyltransferase
MMGTVLRSASFKRFIDYLHRSVARSRVLTELALKTRNQCEQVIGYALGAAELAHVSDSEKYLMRLVGGHVHQFIDVGANVGDWTAAMIEASPAASGVLCEPVDWCFEELLRRFSCNKNLRLLRVALSDQIGRAPFFVASGDAKSSSLVHLPDVGGGRSIEVEVTTIDALSEKLVHHPFLTFEYEGLPSIPRICSLPRGDTPKGHLDGALPKVG